MEGVWQKTSWGKPAAWQGKMGTFLEKGIEQAKAELFHAAPRPKLDPRRMDRPRTLLWFRDRMAGGLETRNGWPNALLIQALIESGDTYTKDIERYWDELIDESGKWRESPTLLSHCMLGMPLLAWHEKTGKERYLNAARSLVDWLLVKHVRSSTGTLPYRPEDPDILLVDTLGMICPLLTRYGVKHGKPEAVQLAKQQLLEFLNLGIDARSGLPFHAYRVDDPKKGEAFGLIGWGRGCGWLGVGLTGTLNWLPREDADYPRIVAATTALLESVQKYQRKDGLWGWALNIPNAAADTSATGMLAWTVRMGIECKALDVSKYQPVQLQAMQGILRHTSADGIVQQSMADAAGVGQYPWLYVHTSWTQGFALLGARGLT
jgi:unsaturated rhamnogalacturonyl hydrolase